MRHHPNSLNQLSSHRSLSLMLALVLALSAFPVRAVKAVPINYQEDKVKEAQETVKKAKVDASVADTLRLKLVNLTAEIKRRSTGTELNQEAIGNITALIRAVSRVRAEDVANAVSSSQVNLTNAENTLNQAKTDLAAVEPETPEKEKEKATTTQIVNSTLNGVIATTKNLKDAKAELDKALLGVYEYVKMLAAEADRRLTPLKTVENQEDRPPADLLTLLPQELPKLAVVLRHADDLTNGWGELSVVLEDVVAEHASNAQPVDEALAALKASATNVVASMDARLKALADYASGKSGDIASLTEQFKQEPAAQAKEARARIKEGTLIVADLDHVGSAWDVLATQLPNSNAVAFDAAQIKTVTTAREGMFDAARNLSQSVSTLQANLAGDFSQFVTEKVRLYYFTDIPRLIKTLNDAAFIKGGDPAAQARATEEFQKLLEIEGDLREAEAEQAKFRDRQVALQRQLDQARQELSSANFLKQAATRRFDELNRRPEGDVPAERKARSEEEKNLRTDEANKAQQRFDELNDEQTGLPAKIREARERRDVAQTELERLSSRLSVTAQNESAAFARARDNAPFWFASPDATNPDPLKRVELSSSTGGDNTITIRGAREDVDKVKEYIAVLDEPAPQARMTLWKLELSSDASNEGTKRFNEALRIVEDELADTRGKIAGAVSLLLDTVNEEANYQADGHRIVTKANGQEVRLSANDARYLMYAPEAMNEIGVAVRTTDGVLSPRALGLKDPGKATTLNEALMILLMSQRERRQNVFHRLERRMPDLLAVTTTLDKKKKKKPEIFAPVGNRWFTRLYTTMGDDLDYGTRRMSCKPNSGNKPCLPSFAGEPCPPDYHKEECPRPGSDIELTRSQGELVYALKFRAIRRLLPHAVELDPWLEEYRVVYQNYVAAKGKANEGQARGEVEEKEKEFPLFRIISSDCGVETREFAPDKDGKVKYTTIRSDETQNKREEVLIKFVRSDGSFLPCRLGFSNARNAAADGMLDNFTKAIEDDLDREFIRPMLDRLRARLRSKGIGVGVIQRTSVLATNRLVARVDPRATAELSLGEETNILQAVQQLAQLTLAAQTGGGLGVLGALRAQAGQERPPEVFGLTTGNTFQVTPIFDPTGQGLRFRFDFVGMTRIREPNDSTEPRLPRIERHTVNTEVQLSNLEIREVSRFESNARLGQPTRIWGGLPILKDIPGLRQIPLIGWFVKKTGKAAVTQQSLIFAQTTMSPTIGDILNLSDDTRIQP